MKKIIIILSLFASCKKSDVKPKSTPQQTITYTCFCKNAKFSVKFLRLYDVIDTVINVQSASWTANIYKVDNNKNYIATMINTQLSKNDSMSFQVNSKIGNIKFSNVHADLSLQPNI